MKSRIDLSFYLVASQGNLAQETFLRIIAQSIEGGVKVVQLREKEASSREMVAMGKNLHSFLKPLGIPLIINDRVDIAHAVKADGVHLGQSDLTISEARAILGKEAIIGLSVETIPQVIAASDEEVDYLAASPLFFTKTKPNCEKQWGFHGLQHICSISPHPILAIGGINESNVERVLRCGAVGVAVVSAVFKASCPKTAANAIFNKINIHRASNA
ncbi:MAG: thiamine phosphate synthase [Verrucomicrobia bacterium]|nr:thiamine phosphate synthase [Verrucomicrobiota bacterium]